jgi:hypothetical protein
MKPTKVPTAEHQRLADSEARRADWKQWGPYVSERAWGTVREDYSAGGDAWSYFPHDHARSRAYRWNEDGLGGFSNRFQNLCLAMALWNERDPILKERLFGLTGPQGNHGEDVKEYYFYLDGTLTHSYMKMLYKYPQVAFPYELLVAENGRRGYGDPEYELIDALRSTFEPGRYFDVFIEYAKAEQEDILCRITAVNRGPDPAPPHILPQIWFRNTWSWGRDRPRPELAASGGAVRVQERHLGERWWTVDGDAPLLFTENETNTERLYGVPNRTPYVKDDFHEAVVHGRAGAVNPAQAGSKTAAHFQAVVPPGGQTHTVRYVPAESDSGMFGGNSNWRGPIWFPVNYLMIESLEKYHRYYGDSLQVELPGGSGRRVTLAQAAGELAQRLTRIFLRDAANGGRRPVFGQEPLFQDDAHWRDHVLFSEYFHGDNGTGAGASHQTRWTALVAKLLQDAEQGKKR